MIHERSYWTETAECPDLGTAPTLPARTDVAIVGGGYTGMSAARALARHGIDATVLERETLGWGASTRNGGFVLPGYKLDAAQLLHRYGSERARALYDASRDSVDHLERLVAEEGIDCELKRSGHVSLASRPSHYRALATAQQVLDRSFGEATILVPPERLREEIDSTRYHGGLLHPTACAVHPAKLFWGLAQAAQRAGARLMEGTAVHSLTREKGGFVLATSRGTLRASHVVIATNGYSDAAAGGVGRRVVPLSSYLIATAPLDESLARRLIPRDRVLSDTKNLLYYFRISADRRLLFGGRVAFTRTTPAESAHRLSDGMAEVFPELRGTGVDFHWWGNVAVTVDQLPHAGGQDGLYFALGYCGHGVAMSIYLGARVGAAIAGRDDLRPFADLPFPAIPFYTGRPWFLPFVGAWYNLVDRFS